MELDTLITNTTNLLFVFILHLLNLLICYHLLDLS